MSEKDKASAQEIQWLIEERKRRVEDTEEQLASEKDENLAKALKGMIAMLHEEIADLERELDDISGEGEDFEAAIRDIDMKIADINSQLGFETDKVVRNNLEVSKRFLQMERNSLLIKMTQAPKRKDPMEEKVEELEALCESRLRMINDLQEKLKKAEKDLSFYKAIAENPERRVSCKTTRVTVTAGALSDLRNEAKVLAINNGNLKTENRELKKQMDLLRNNVRELTQHCRDSDSEILKLQSKVFELRKQLEDRQ